MTCNHKDCNPVDNDWLEYVLEGKEHDLRSHPYCIYCGLIKNLTDGKAKRLGHYTNVLSNMSDALSRLTKVQMRLIIRELESIDGFEDRYSMTEYDQRRIFIKIVRKHCDISERFINSFL
ncbi:MAG: hypothetical protein SVJ22_03350 [Halobacteriota archaeon]|nr:hypothetical protein [Halobacteriota archaeon]